MYFFFYKEIFLRFFEGCICRLEVIGYYLLLVVIYLSQGFNVYNIKMLLL